jgi:hypothetical protein
VLPTYPTVECYRLHRAGWSMGEVAPARFAMSSLVGSALVLAAPVVLLAAVAPPLGKPPASLTPGEQAQLLKERGEHVRQALVLRGQGKYGEALGPAAKVVELTMPRRPRTTWGTAPPASAQRFSHEWGPLPHPERLPAHDTTRGRPRGLLTKEPAYFLHLFARM